MPVQNLHILGPLKSGKAGISGEIILTLFL